MVRICICVVVAFDDFAFQNTDPRLDLEMRNGASNGGCGKRHKSMRM